MFTSTSKLNQSRVLLKKDLISDAGPHQNSAAEEGCAELIKLPLDKAVEFLHNFIKKYNTLLPIPAMSIFLKKYQSARLGDMSDVEFIYERTKSAYRHDVEENKLLTIHDLHSNMMLVYNDRARKKKYLLPGQSDVYKRSIKEIAHTYPSAFTFNTLIRHHVEHEEYEDAERILNQYRQQGYQPDVWTYQYQIKIIFNLYGPKETTRFFSSLEEDVRKESDIFRIYFTIFIKNKPSIQEIQGLIDAINPHRSDVLLRTILKVYFSAKEPQDVQDFFNREWDKYNCLKTQRTYSSMLSYLYSYNPEQSLAYLKEAIEKGFYINDQYGIINDQRDKRNSITIDLHDKEPKGAGSATYSSFSKNMICVILDYMLEILNQPTEKEIIDVTIITGQGKGLQREAVLDHLRKKQADLVDLQASNPGSIQLQFNTVTKEFVVLKTKAAVMPSRAGSSKPYQPPHRRDTGAATSRASASDQTLFHPGKPRPPASRGADDKCWRKQDDRPGSKGF
jgi:pentatricopeptide repeat protein